MKILVTGAHGFVGTRLMKELERAIAAPSIQGMNEKQMQFRMWGSVRKIRKSPIMQMYFFRFIWRKHQTEKN